MLDPVLDDVVEPEPVTSAAIPVGEPLGETAAVETGVGTACGAAGGALGDARGARVVPAVGDVEPMTAAQAVSTVPSSVRSRVLSVAACWVRLGPLVAEPPLPPDPALGREEEPEVAGVAALVDEEVVVAVEAASRAAWAATRSACATVTARDSDEVSIVART